MAKAFYASRISEHLATTPEGYLICKAVPIARTGQQKYRGHEFGLKGDSDVYDVSRGEAEVFSSKAIASFEGKPVTDEHPPEDVTAENFAQYLKGTVREVRRGDGEYRDCLMADLVIYDSALAEEVRSGAKRDISCGYDCLWVPTGDHTYEQKDIRGNHVAVVPKGRAGHRVVIRDSEKIEGGNSKMSMKTLWGTIMKSFAKDASPEEMAQAMELMGQDAEPAQPIKATALDADLEERLCRIEDAIVRITDAMCEEPEEEPEEEPKEEPEPVENEKTALDALEEELSAPAAEEDVAEDPKAIEHDGTDKCCCDECAGKDEEFEAPDGEEDAEEVRDAAMEAIDALKPVVAGIRDAGKRHAAADALATLIRGHVQDAQYASLSRAKAASKVMDSAPNDHQLGVDIRKKYNPHFKEVK